MVSERLRQIEREIDEHYRSNSLIRLRSLGPAILHYLKVCEEQNIAALLGIHVASQGQLDVLTDQIINRSKPALQWVHRACTNDCIAEFEYDDAALGYALELARLADSYLTFESAFTYASADLLRLELDDRRILTAGAMRSDSIYDAYDRLRDLEKQSADELGIAAFLPTLSGTLRVKEGSFTYAFSPKLVAEALEFVKPSLEQRFRLPVDWAFPEFNLEQFRNVAVIIWVLAFIHLQARLLAIRKGCQALGIETSVLLISKSELIARLTRYSRVAESAVRAIVEHLTFGNVGQNSPDPALQPLMHLNETTVALSPTIICNSSMERNLTVLLNRVPDAKRVYSTLNRQKEELMRRALSEKLEGLGFEFWHGDIPEWQACSEIDWVLVSRAEKRCLVAELKSFIAPAEPSEVINRSEEIAKGIQQIQCRRQRFAELPMAMHAALNVDEDFAFAWAVISQNSVGANYVQKEDVPVINGNHLVATIKAHQNLSYVCDWLTERRYLPRPGIEFNEIPVEATINGYTVEWYGLQLIGA